MKLDGGSHDHHPTEHHDRSSATANLIHNLLADNPEAKRRKYILVDDIEKGTKQRVHFKHHNVGMSEIPDSYRKAHSVYPRSYFPMQMQSPKRRPSRGNRFFQADDEDGGGGGGSGGSRSGRHHAGGGGGGEDSSTDEAVMGRTTVPVPMLEGSAEGESELELAVPKIGRAKRRREEILNDLGYLMSWNQSKMFAGRTIFLQKARKFFLLNSRLPFFCSHPPTLPSSSKLSFQSTPIIPSRPPPTKLP